MGWQTFVDKSAQYDQYKADFTAPIRDITYNDAAELVLPSDNILGQMKPLPIDDWAFGQVCTKLGGLPRRYLQRCPDWLRSEQLNYWQEQRGKFVDKNKADGGRMSENWFIRTYKDSVRATLTDHYAPLGNTELLEVVRDLAVESDLHGKMIRPYIGPHEMHLRMMTDDRDNGNYGTGVYIGNGEIGNRRISIFGVVQTTSCTNSQIITEGGLIRKHMFMTTEELKYMVHVAIGKAFEVSDKMWKNFAVAERKKLPSLTDTLDMLRKKHNLSKEVRDAALAGSNNSHTVKGVIDGLSFAAHSVEGLSQKDRVDLETMAGAILADPNDLFGAAARMAKLQEVEVGVE
jgi:hypothetical protein